MSELATVPEAICGAVYVEDMANGQGGYVPVCADEPFNDPEGNYILHEYVVGSQGHDLEAGSLQADYVAVHEGEVRGCLLELTETDAVAGWELLSYRRAFGYYETHAHVSGVGGLTLRSAFYPERLYYELPPARTDELIFILPGERFQVRDSGLEDAERLAVLAVFPGKSFDESYEKPWQTDEA